MTSDFVGSYEFGPFRLDAGERVLLQDGQFVPLRPKDLELLLALVENSGRLIEKDELLRRVWPDSFVEEANLSHHVFTLRRVLGDDREASRYIETVPRRGYRFVAPITKKGETRGGSVAVPDDAAPPEQAADRASHADPGEATPRIIFQWRAFAFATLASILAVALATIIYSWVSSKRASGRASARHVIAVLPFKAVVPSQRDEALELGMADTLITKLGSIRDIRTRPIGAVRQYTSLEQDPIAAGRALRVAIVLDGSIQRAGDRIRVTVRLLSVEDGATVWAGQFDEPFTDIFAVQDAISDHVTRSLAVRLSTGEKRLLAKRYTDNVAAYELYLKGRFFWNKRTDDGMKNAIDYFRQAIAMAPDYSLAYSGLADSYALLSIVGNIAPHQTFPQAREAAERALALDDTLAEAHTSLAFVKEAFDWDWGGADRAYRRALDLDPNYPSAHHRHGLFLCVLARCDEGLAQLEQARQLDPTSVIINMDAGLGYYIARRYDEAIDRLRNAIELDPTSARPHFYLADCFVQKGMLDEAIAAARTASELSQGRAAAALAFTYAAAGRRAEARQILQELTVQAQNAYVSPLAAAAAYVALGEHDTAFAWLEKGIDQRAYVTARVPTDPRFDALRSHPRYRDLVRRLGFPQ
jgi:DNA-binding winged helix-turn-helix (wHTH) protein/TolB-like protein/Tfp pilus assembly protein PilF